MKKEYIKSGRVNQKLETRSKILTSAQYYINNGLEFTLEDIAKKSGISRATIYRYYSKVEILANEAGLDLNTKSPENIIENLKEKNIEDIILGIQHYYNKLAIDHEGAFRKYLSTVLTSNPSELKRGARRKKTLQLAFENASVQAQEKEKLVNLFTLLMGIEPLIVTKDVSGLNNDQSVEIMKWGVQLILKGYFESNKK
ncbi:TetR/AcrR family transcriptional regulator [Lutimonas zeaxanthinifaciens]|uniref:TetR/AcrR family transcriptional regulator n=1 Tax=Lutimonas zeaxanthinifaciens TaxID=3060215 RepID=UPI00265CDC3F|nr:TetR/AcrR family transcriptional regulator [Lutimonas sp. YSD2104]WKK67051.1 TetR/AcrR family transcriptional regulator [Lutimonas sp. YSD2104]